jgi:hypothetical protein
VKNIKEQPKAKAQTLSKPNDLFGKLNNWFEKHSKKWPYIISALCIIYSILLFNARVSEANDDSLYIEAGYKYAHNFTSYFYTANAPLYPMFLSLPIAIFGVNLIVLKLFSVLFNFLAVLLFYKVFRNRLPNLVFFPTIIAISINALMQYYASMTYSESFFMFLQACFFYIFFKLYDTLENGETSLKQNYKQWLLLGFIIVVLGFCRSIAIVVCPAVVVFFLFQKQFKNAGYAVLSFLIVKIPLELIKAAVWGKINQYGNQTKILLLKDPYDENSGTDDFFGFCMRLVDNSQIYLSRRFFQILGFMSEETVTVSGFVAIVVYGLLALGGVQMLMNKNKKLLIVPIYCFALMLASFIVLQARWDQARIILVCVPMMLIMIFYGLYYSVIKSSFFQNAFVLLVIVVCSSIFISSTKKGIKNLPVVSKNLKGDIYYGYTPDWVNFLQASEWCAENLPKETSKVASRKAPMSFIYGKGMQFYPVYAVPFKDPGTNTANPDSVLALFQRNKVTHVLLGSLRMNPAKNNGIIINTMHNVIGPVAQKYPQKLKLIHQVGDLEPTYIYEIKY